MKTSKILSFLAIFAMCTLTSCLGTGEDSQKVKSTLGNLFNAIVDKSTGEITLYNNASFQVEWDYSKNVANLTAMGIQLPNSTILPRIQIDNAPIKSSANGWIDVSVTDYSPVDYAGTILFNYFTMKVSQTSFSVSYLINNQYQVYAFPQLFGVQGNTRITNVNTGEVFQYNGDMRPSYYISYDTATKNGFIVIQNAKFKESEATSNIKLPLLPFNVVPAGTSGSVHMASNESKPALMSSTLDATTINGSGSPINNATATNVVADYDPNYGMTIRFDYILDNGTLGTEKYHVDFDVNFNTTSGSL